MTFGSACAKLAYAGASNPLTTFYGGTNDSQRANQASGELWPGWKSRPATIEVTALRPDGITVTFSVWQDEDTGEFVTSEVPNKYRVTYWQGSRHRVTRGSTVKSQEFDRLSEAQDFSRKYNLKGFQTSISQR